MTPISIVYHDQSRIGGPDGSPSERGNCDKTCLATLIGCDPSEIPDYQELSGDAWWQERDRFLHTKGFHVVTFGGLVGVPVECASLPESLHAGNTTMRLLRA